MKIALVITLLAASALAQDQSAVVPAACGPQDASFDVKLDKSQHSLTQPEPGKARIYFVQDIGQVSCWGSCVTSRVGLDGAWVGANHDNSYFSVSVEPGEHHMCAKPQSILRRLVGLAHFTAEAGKVYYFRTRFSGSQNQALLDL